MTLNPKTRGSLRCASAPGTSLQLLLVAVITFLSADTFMFLTQSYWKTWSSQQRAVAPITCNTVNLKINIINKVSLKPFQRLAGSRGSSLGRCVSSETCHHINRQYYKSRFRHNKMQRIGKFPYEPHDWRKTNTHKKVIEALICNMMKLKNDH